MSASEPPGNEYPVNFVVLKAGGKAGARVYHYGTGGETSDYNLIGPDTLKAVSICYGLNQEPLPPQEQTNLCSLPGSDDPGDLIGVGIACPTTGEDVYSIHVIKKGQQFEYDECTCGETAKFCDPAIPPGQLDSCLSLITTECPSEDNGGSYTISDPYQSRDACLEANQLKEVPWTISPWNDDSGWCTSNLGSYGCRTW